MKGNRAEASPPPRRLATVGCGTRPPVGSRPWGGHGAWALPARWGRAQLATCPGALLVWGRVRVWCTQGCGDGAKFGPGEAGAGAAPAPSGPEHPRAPRSLPVLGEKRFFRRDRPKSCFQTPQRQHFPVGNPGQAGVCRKTSKKGGRKGRER